MITHRTLDDWYVKNPVVTIGVFDGVHIGHQNIIASLRKYAGKLDGESVVMTFWPHPRAVLGDVGRTVKLLTTVEEKSSLLDHFGIDHLLIIPFNPSFASFSARDFIENYLVSKMGIRHLVMGHNHHFGNNREGSYETVLQYSQKLGFTVNRIDAVMAEEQEISSSLVRQVLESGNIGRTNMLLGYEYRLSGTVVGGTRTGRKIGFPTANILPESPLKAIPPDGVYAVRVKVDEVIYPGMLNIGSRPTLNHISENRSVEVHILRFDKTIYHRNITISFVERIRDEMKFNGIDALKKQLTEDRRMVLHLLEG